jgi:hypothetical protein
MSVRHRARSAARYGVGQQGQVRRADWKSVRFDHARSDQDGGKGRTTSALTTSPSRNDSMILIRSFSVNLPRSAGHDTGASASGTWSLTESQVLAAAPDVLYADDALELLARRLAVDDSDADGRLLRRQTRDGADDLHELVGERSASGGMSARGASRTHDRGRLRDVRGRVVRLDRDDLQARPAMRTGSALCYLDETSELT